MSKGLPLLDWLIVGGGLHGVHHALSLQVRARIPAERMAILDPHNRLLARWEDCTANTGMRYLRSSRVHHVGLLPHDLEEFAQRRQRWDGQFRGPYGRPSLEIFQAHCHDLIARYGLDRMHIHGRAMGLRRITGGWAVATAQGELAARHILLAISVGEQPRWPPWAQELRTQGAAIRHIYEAHTRRADLPQRGAIAVIGGGITAAQAAMSFAEANPGAVQLVLRHPIREALFDSGPCWVGPACLERFWNEPDLAQRRVLIRGARNPGSMPDDVLQRLRVFQREGRLAVQQSEVWRAEFSADQRIGLSLGTDQLTVDHVVLATGFDAARPGGAWLDQAIVREQLPIAACGYPILDRSLQWAPGLFVTGPLAELEIGPPARNIVGARHAAERIARVAAVG